MNFIWRYNFVNNYSEILAQIIGASTSLSLIDIETHDDDNCLYVAYAGSDTTGDGTSAKPFRTISKAISMIDSNIEIITIQDSNSYDVGASYLDVNGLTLQGIQGEKPVIYTTDTTLNTLIQLETGSKIVNLELYFDNDQQITGVYALGGEIRNVTINGATKNGVNVSSSAAENVTIKNSIIKNTHNWGTLDGNGIMAQADCTIERCLICDNDRAGIYVVGAVSKTINCDYLTIAGNQYGLYGSGSSNSDIDIDDSIIYENTIYDYYYASGNLTNICTGSVNGSPVISGNVSRFNPFFVGNGDYRLRTVHNGFTDGSFTSSALGISSGGVDLGCYLYNRTLLSQNYAEFDTERPEQYRLSVNSVESRVYYTNQLRPRLLGKGQVNEVACTWNGQDNVLTNTELENLKNMFNAEGTVFLSTDGGATFTEYLIDKTKAFNYEPPLNIDDMDLYMNVGLTLIEL